MSRLLVAIGLLAVLALTSQSSALLFNVVPQIDSVSPQDVFTDGGTIEVRGSNFDQHSRCVLDGQSFLPTRVSSDLTTLQCRMPNAHTNRPGNKVVHTLCVQNSNSQRSNLVSFNVLDRMPGFAVAWDSTLLNFVQESLRPWLHRIAPGTILPDQEVTKKALFSSITTKLTNIVLRSLDIGKVTSSLHPDSPRTIQFHTKNTRVSIGMDYAYQTKILKIHGSGHADDQLTMDVDVAFSIITGADGQPRFINPRFDLKVTQFTVHASPPIVNTVIPLIRPILIAELRDSIKTKAMEALLHDVPALFRNNLTMRADLIPGMTLDMSLLSDIKYSSRHVTLDMRGQFRDFSGAYPELDSVQDRALEQPDLPNLPASQRMVRAVVSDYTANSALLTLFHEGRLSFLADSTMDDLPFKLNTTFFRGFVKPMFELYPNMLFAINATASQAPQITFEANTGARLNAHANLTFVIDCESGPCNSTLPHGQQYKPIFTLAARVSALLSAAYQHGNVTGELSAVDLTIDLAWSDLGEFDLTALRGFFKLMVVPQAVKRINAEQLQPGMEPRVRDRLPQGDFLLSKMEIIFGQHYLLLGSDASIVPPALSH